MSTDLPHDMDAPCAPAVPPSLAEGAQVIKSHLATMPASPGVYRMLDRKGEALYVGKARNLKKRVVSYTHIGKLPERLRRMVAETRAMEVVTTHTEVEALLLESNLIKRLRPRFNVILRDDKSFPYILIKGGHDFPQLAKYRGARTEDGAYYGPFASAQSVNRTLTALQRAFLLRSCSDSVFASRTRPCLLHQIKRCCAPCVGKVGEAEYAALVREARDFLEGRDTGIQKTLSAAMQEASDNLEFERAALYRDRIRALAHIQARQDINLPGMEDADVIALHRAGGQTAVQVFFFRGGRNYGNRSYFPRHDRHADDDEVLEAFVGQFYDNKIPPPMVLLSHDAPGRGLLARALAERAGGRVELQVPKRGEKRKLVDHARANAETALARRMAESASQRRLLEGVADVFGLEGTPERIEVYDNSHIGGTRAVGAMVVAGPDGFIKSAYRKFNIKGEVEPGDDYGMMREVLSRRFARALKEDPEREGGAWPDLVMIDGGKGQLSSAEAALADLGVEDVELVAVAKGPERDAGRERFFRPGGREIAIEPNDPVMYFLQRLRDEAHRFAIGAHRTRRSKAIGQSALDQIPGVGARRKKALLHRFGSMRGVAQAGLADLESVEGISRTVARKIYDHFHGES